MTKRSFTFTRHDGRQTRVFMSGPDKFASSPAESIGRFARNNGRAAGVGLGIAGFAGLMTLTGPRPKDEPLVRDTQITTAAETGIGTAHSAISGHGITRSVVSDPVITNRVSPLLATPAQIDTPPVIDTRSAPPPVASIADAETGPFRAGMRTAFSNNQMLTAAMAENMNIAFEQFRKHGLTEQASIAFTLQGVNESLAGTTLVEGGGGDGVGYFQFSRWSGNGVGSEIAALTKPGTERQWQPADFSAADGNTATAIRNAVDATVQLLHEDTDYAALNRLARDPEASASDLARATTRDFMRPSTTLAARMDEISGTITRNQVAMRANIDALMPAASTVTPAAERRTSP